MPDVFHDNATHLKMFGGRSVDCIPGPNGADLLVPDPASKNGFFSFFLSQQEYAAFLSIDDYRKKMFVEDLIKKRDPHLFQKLNETVFANNFKVYPYEPLNPRISKVTPFVDENTVHLRMTVDGKEKNLTVSNKEAVDAFHAGALPLNVLANRALAMSENLNINLQNSYEMGLDEQLESSRSASLGFRK